MIYRFIPSVIDPATSVVVSAKLPGYEVGALASVHCRLGEAPRLGGADGRHVARAETGPAAAPRDDRRLAPAQPDRDPPFADRPPPDRHAPRTAHLDVTRDAVLEY